MFFFNSPDNFTIESLKDGIRHYCNKNKFNFLSRSKKVLPGFYGIDRQCLICKQVLSNNHFRVMTKIVKDIPYQYLDSYCKECSKKRRANWLKHNPQHKERIKTDPEYRKRILDSKKRWREKNKEKIKLYNEKNKERIKTRKAEYKKRNADRIEKYWSAFKEKNKERLIEYWRNYREKNKEIINKKKRERYWKEKATFLSGEN